MKTAFVLLVCGLISAQAWAGTIPDGRYDGKGSWKSVGAQGVYEVETVVAGSHVSTRYKMPNKAEETWTFEMAVEQNGLFKVKAYGSEIGLGYCLDHTTVCHYQIQVGELELEETLTFLDGQLYRFGSKKTSTTRVMWQEAMTPKKGTK